MSFQSLRIAGRGEWRCYGEGRKKWIDTIFLCLLARSRSKRPLYSYVCFTVHQLRGLQCLLSRSNLQQTQIYISSSASAFGDCITMKIPLSTFQHLASYLRQGTGLRSPSKLILRAIILSYLHANTSEGLSFFSSEPTNRSLPL